MNDLFATVEDWTEGRITRCGVWYKPAAGLPKSGSLRLFTRDITDMFAGAA